MWVWVEERRVGVDGGKESERGWRRKGWAWVVDGLFEWSY